VGSDGFLPNCAMPIVVTVGSVTVTLVEPVTESDVAVTVVLPVLAAVTNPLRLTVATVGFALRH